MRFTLISRKWVYIYLTARLADGSDAVINNGDVQIALTPIRGTPNTATVWYTVTYAAGVASVLLAGPQADPTGAVVLDSAGNDLWLKIVDADEVDAVFVARVNMR